MKVPRRSPRRRTLVFVVIFVVVALFVVGSFAQGQGKPVKPRNNDKLPENKTLGVIYGSNPANDCWKHHQGEGMRDTVIVYPILPTQFQVGKQYKVPVQIINPWKQELQDMSLEVALIGDNQILTVEGQATNAAAAVDRKYSFSGVLGVSQDHPTRRQGSDPNVGGPGSISFKIQIPPGARTLVAHAEFVPGTGHTGTPSDLYGFGFRLDSARNWAQKDPKDNGTRTNLTRDIVVELTGQGTGLLEVEHYQGPAARTDVFVNATIIMGQSSGSERSYSIKVPFDSLAKQTAGIVEVPVTPFAKGVQNMEFRIRAKLYYKHQDPTTPNEDYYTRVARLNEDEDLLRGDSIIPMRAAVVGDSFIASPYGAAAPPAASEDWKFILAETSGFAAAGLLVPSLLLGGTYGKGSRRFFNNLLGGAKRRVMFHNILSLGLSLVALVHIWLFMLEIRYTILMGVMWGGLAALSLLVLGLTGYYQVPLIQRHGYKWWRLTHLTFGLLVVVFVSYHAIADGPDFFFVKEQLPKWINDINLAQK